MAARRLSSLLSHSLSAGSASKLLSQAVQANGVAAYFVTLTTYLGLWCGRILLASHTFSTKWYGRILLCLTSSMEEKRKLQIPCLELRLPRIVLFRELNL
ncbi:hypothetical protein ABKV19_000113 [Rosa sericea]